MSTPRSAIASKTERYSVARQRLQLVLSCEHGGNRVPASYQHLFRRAGRMLASHRGWDPGALALARRLARWEGSPLFEATTTRLLVDLNRSPHNPAVFSRFTRTLPETARQHLLALYHAPHRQRVYAAVRARLRRGPVLHVAVHSFTPLLAGVRRNFELALLYDPARAAERRFCRAWQAALREQLGMRVRRNAPYRGASDGLTTALRASCGARYLGIELEINQRLFKPTWPGLARRIHQALGDVLRA